jgi:hypothetical protein
VMVLMPRVTIVDADKISDEAAAAVAEVSQTVNGALRLKLHETSTRRWSRSGATSACSATRSKSTPTRSATSRCRLRSGRSRLLRCSDAPA